MSSILFYMYNIYTYTLSLGERLMTHPFPLWWHVPEDINNLTSLQGKLYKLYTSTI